MVQFTIRKLDMAYFKDHFTKSQNNIIQRRGVTMKNAPFHELNKAIIQLFKEFSQLCNEVTGRVNLLTDIHEKISQKTQIILCIIST